MISVRIIREQIGASLREADGEVVTGNMFHVVVEDVGCLGKCGMWSKSNGEWFSERRGVGKSLAYDVWQICWSGMDCS